MVKANHLGSLGRLALSSLRVDFYSWVEPEELKRGNFCISTDVPLWQLNEYGRVVDWPYCGAMPASMATLMAVAQ